MPKTQGQGQSQATLGKQRDLELILDQHISTVRAILSKPYAINYPQAYHYIDLTSGCGHNEAVDCEGSPVVFQRAIKRAGLRYDAHFIDKDPINTMKLYGGYRWGSRETIHTGDHSDVAPDIIAQWPKQNAYGLIYADLNGIPPFDLLALLGTDPRLAKIDFLIRCNSLAIKRNGGGLLDELARINKKFWIVRALDDHDRWQWSFLLGLNWDGLKAQEYRGFHYATSETGRAILERMHYTKPELQAIQQPELPYLTYQEYLNHPTYQAIRAQALERAGGTCERCHEGQVSEVHHTQYPPWGTFEENADHLLAVCHRCHCQIHNKEN